MMIRRSIAVGCCALAASLLFAGPSRAAVSFSSQIAPILAKKCIACHGPKDAKGKYQVHNYQSLLKAGDSGTAGIVPQKPDASELYTRLIETDESIRMPQDSPPLAAEEIALVKQWIAEGAKYDAKDPSALLTLIVPKSPHPAAPAAYKAPLPITALAFSPDGSQLAASGYREITVWNAADGALVRRIGDVAQRTYSLAYSPDGKLLAAASGTPGQIGEIRLYDAADGKLLADLATLPDCAFCVAFRPDGAKLAGCGADRSIRIFDVASRQEEKLIEDHADWVFGVAWSPDGKMLASASRDKTTKAFDAEKGLAVATYAGHNQPVNGVAFSADGKLVLSAGADNQIHLWNPLDGKKAANIGGYGGEVYQVFVQGDAAFSCSADKQIRQHKVSGRNQVRAYGGLNDWALSVAYHDGAKRVAGGSFDGEIRIWNSDDGMLIVAFKAAPGLEAKP